MIFLFTIIFSFITYDYEGPSYTLTAIFSFVLSSLITGIAVFVVAVMIKVVHHSRKRDMELEEKKQVQNTLKVKVQELADIQKIANVGSAVWNLQSKYIECSEEFRFICGFSKQDIQVVDFCRQVYHDDIAYFKTAVENLKATNQPVIIDFRIVTLQGELKIIQAHFKVFLDKKMYPEKLNVLIQDVTKLKKTEELLLTKALQLERSNKELHQFVSVASHDLKEPLRKLQTFSELLRTEYGEDIGVKGQMYISALKRSSVRLQNLIEDLTTFSKVGLRRELFEETNMKDLLNHLIGEIYMDSGNNAKIIIDELPVLNIIPDQVVQLFIHLISNAIKYKKENEMPVILITSEIIPGRKLFQKERMDKVNRSTLCLEYCNIYINDNGIGFDERYLDKMFTIFQQLHNRNKYDGTGIGLAICKKIVENHSGFITATSKVDVGSTFIITLPYNQVQEPMQLSYQEVASAISEG